MLPEPEEGGLLRLFSKVKSLFVNKLRYIATSVTEQRYVFICCRVHLLCEYNDGIHFVEHSEGFPLTTPKEFVKKAAPVLKWTLKLMKLGSAVGKCFGFPIPGMSVVSPIIICC